MRKYFLLIFLLLSLKSLAQNKSFITLELMCSKGDIIELFYATSKDLGFNKIRSFTQHIDHSKVYQKISFFIDDSIKIEKIRIDFGDVPGNSWRVKKIEFNQNSHKSSISPKEIAADFHINNFSKIEEKDSVFLLKSVSINGRCDPQIVLHESKINKYKYLRGSTHLIYSTISIYIGSSQPEELRLFYTDSIDGLIPYDYKKMEHLRMKGNSQKEELVFNLYSYSPISAFRFDFEDTFVNTYQIYEITYKSGPLFFKWEPRDIQKDYAFNTYLKIFDTNPEFIEVHKEPYNSEYHPYFHTNDTLSNLFTKKERRKRIFIGVIILSLFLFIFNTHVLKISIFEPFQNKNR